ncbi:MAG: hypothetical protein J4F34_08825 [Gemmatimonadetes bacterium]|nr:hypothetical protein [Gemmatimonadota bacterium]
MAREMQTSKTRSAGTPTVTGSRHRGRRTRKPVANGSVQSLLDDWLNQAEALRRYGGGNLAVVLERCADELEATLRERDETTLTLTDAARESGYTREHLGRLVRDGKIPNAGRPGAPRIALKHLPRKAQDQGSPSGPRLARTRGRRELSNRQIVESIIEKGIE